MALCQELQIPASGHRNCTASWFKKRQGSFPHAWNYKFVVLNKNFLFTYTKADDPKPWKVINIDGAKIATTSQFKKHPHTIKITTTAGKQVFFDAESAETCANWISVISSAGYSFMKQKALDAEWVMHRCKQILVDYMTQPPQPKRSAQAYGEEEKLDAASAADSKASELAKAVEPASPTTSYVDILAAIIELVGQHQSAVSYSKRLSVGLETAPELTSGSDQEASAAAVEAESSPVASNSEALQDACAEKDQQIASLQSELAAAQQQATEEHDLRISELEQHEAITEQLKVQLDQAHRQIQSLRAQFESAQSDWAAEKAELEARGRSAADSKAQPDTEATNGQHQMASEHEPVSSLVDISSPSASSTTDPFYNEWAPFYHEAQSLERAGRQKDAEQQYAVVLQIRRDRSGEDSVAVASASRDLGRVLAMQRRFEAAEKHYRRAVVLYSTLLGDAHPNSACALTDLAAVLREQDKFADAEQYASKAVESLKQGVGESDVSTATALYNLAGLAKRQGKYEQAERSYLEALKIFREKLGDGQGETADTLYQMGCLQRRKGEYLKASQYFNQAADSYSQAYGPSDKRVQEATRRAKNMADKFTSKRPHRRR